MKQKTKLSLTQKPSLVLDQIDMQTITSGAEHLAERLVKKHKGNLKEIEKEVLAIENPEVLAQVQDFNFEEEVLWAARWIAAIKK